MLLQKRIRSILRRTLPPAIGFVIGLAVMISLKAPMFRFLDHVTSRPENICGQVTLVMGLSYEYDGRKFTQLAINLRGLPETLNFMTDTGIELVSGKSYILSYRRPRIGRSAPTLKSVSEVASCEMGNSLV